MAKQQQKKKAEPQDNLDRTEVELPKPPDPGNEGPSDDRRQSVIRFPPLGSEVSVGGNQGACTPIVHPPHHAPTSALEPDEDDHESLKGIRQYSRRQERSDSELDKEE